MARQYYYYKALRKTITQFLDIFNDIKIVRYTQAGTFSKYVEVPLKFSPKEKIWYWLNERKDDEMLPMMSVSMTGIEFAMERSANTGFKMNVCGGEGAGEDITRLLAPSPYDISFQVNIWALYMTDIDQIIEQILPWFQPHIFIRIRLDEINTQFDAKVVFRSASPEHESEYSDEGRRVLKYSLDFSVQTMLFRPAELSGVTHKIITNYYVTQEAFREALNNVNTQSTFTSAASGESQVITAIEPFYTEDDKVIFKYEIYQFGNEVGNDLIGTFDK
jgi:hypothetical protein